MAGSEGKWWNRGQQISAFFGRRLPHTEINVGFLDVYHFTESVLHRWRTGDFDETTATADDFFSIHKIKNPEEHELKLAVGALYIKGFVANHYLSHCLIEAGVEYLGFECAKFKKITLYATIFAPAGEHWATNSGFEMDIRGPARESKYDLFVGEISRRQDRPKKIFKAFSRSC